MKKIFLPLLALVGMVTGFTLTSCGGGGGGGNMSGLAITVQSGVTYTMVFDGKLVGSDDAYSVSFVAPKGETSPVTVNISSMPEGFDGRIRDVDSLVGMSGSVSADTIDADDTELFFHILSAVNPEEEGEEAVTQSLYAPARFKIVKNGALVQMQWQVMAYNLEDEEGDDVDGTEDTKPTDLNLFTPVDLAPQEVIAVTRQ